jgi:hypothetical protein
MASYLGVARFGLGSLYVRIRRRVVKLFTKPMDVDLDKVLQRVSGVKLPGGVVGKICVVLIVASICILGLALATRNEWISVAAIVAIFLLVFSLLWRLINFADRNPQAALFEGAEFLLHEQILAASKYEPVIPRSLDSLTEERPTDLSQADIAALNQPDDAQLLASHSPETEG